VVLSPDRTVELESKSEKRPIYLISPGKTPARLWLKVSVNVVRDRGDELGQLLERFLLH
jgi:hypothetical protein